MLSVWKQATKGGNVPAKLSKVGLKPCLLDMFCFPGSQTQDELRIWPITSIVKIISSAWLGFHSLKNNVSTSKY